MVSIVQYSADALLSEWRRPNTQPWTTGLDERALPCRVASSLRLGINTTYSSWEKRGTQTNAYLHALRQAQACILAYALAYERLLRLSTLPILPGGEQSSTSDEDANKLPQDYTTSSTLATAQTECAHAQQEHRYSTKYTPESDRDYFDLDRQTQPRVDLTRTEHLREHAKKKKKNQASKNALDSDDDGDKKADGAGQGGSGDNNDGAAGAGDGAGASGGGDGQDPNGNNNGGGDDDDSWETGNKKKGKKAKKQNAFSWAALDEEENNEDGVGGEDAPAIDAPAEVNPEDEWGGFTTASSKKKKKKGKGAETALEEVNLDGSGAPKIDLDFGGSTDNKSSFGGGWGSGWGASANKWGFSATGDTNDAEDTTTETTKVAGNTFNFGFTPSTEEKPATDTPAEDDPWAGFSTKKSKKKKGGAAAIVEEPPPPEPEPLQVAPVEPEPVDNFSWGMSAKDKKKLKKAKKGGLLLPFAEVEPALPEPEPPAPLAPIEDVPLEDDAGSKEPEPEAAIEQAPEEDPWSGFMSAKDLKKAKKAAKKAGLASPPLDFEPTVDEPIVEPPPPEPVEEFAFGMSAKERKKAAKKAAKTNAFAGLDEPMTEEPNETAIETALVVTEPPIEPLPEAPPPPATSDDNSWTFGGWGKSKAATSKDEAVMVPESIDEPKAAEDDWGGWTTGKKKTKKGKKDIAVEIIEQPSRDIPVQQPEEDAWGWTTGKKSKTKKGAAIDPMSSSPPEQATIEAPIVDEPPISTDIPVEQSEAKPEEDIWATWGTSKKKKKKGKKDAVIEPEPVPVPVPVSMPPEVVEEPVLDVPPEEPLIDIADPAKPPEDDAWAFTTTKSKKDKKKKKGKSEEPILEKVVSEDKPADEVVAIVDEAPISEDHAPEEPVPEAFVEPEVIKSDSKTQKKEAEKSSGWGSIWGSSKTSKDSSKSSKKKEKELREAEEAEEAQRKADEAQRQADEDAAFAAAMEGEPVDLLDSAPEELPKVEAAGWGFWGAKKVSPAPETVPANEAAPKDDGLQIMPEVTLAEAPKSSSKTKVKTGAKGSVAERIKALQSGGEGDVKDVKKAKKHIEDNPASPDPVPLEPSRAPETEVQIVPEVQVVPIVEAPVEETVPTKKSSFKDKKKSKSSKKDKESSLPPEVEPLVEPVIVDIPPATSPIPGGFPEDEIIMPEIDDAPQVVETPVLEKKKSGKDKLSSKSKSSSKTSSTSSSKESKSPKAEILQPPIDEITEIEDKPAKLPTPPPEPKSAKKERPKVVRDQGGSSWGFWGSTAKPDPKEERRKERKSRDDSTPVKERPARPGLSRSKSERKPSERDHLDKSSGSDKAKRNGIERPSASRGMSFSGVFGMGGTPSRSRSVRQSTPARRSSHRQSVELDGTPMSPLSDDVDPAKFSSKAAQLMGTGGKRQLNRRESTREKRKSRGPPDPYAIDDDMVMVDAADDGEHPSSNPSQRKQNREPIVMSGGLGEDLVFVDSNGPSDGHEIVTGPDDLAFVERATRPPMKRSATSAKKTTGLLGGLLGSLKPSNQSRNRGYDSDDISRRKRQVEDDDEGSRRLRREARRIHRSKRSDTDGLTDAGPILSPSDDEDAEQRHKERRARRVERNAAEAAEAEQREARRREKDRAREEERRSRRARDEEEAEARKLEEKRVRRAARRVAEEQEAQEAERRARRREKEKERQERENEERRTRREERRARHEKERVRPSRHRSDYPAPIDDYFDTRNGDHGVYEGEAATAPARDTHPYLSKAPDKTSSWVHSVNEDPPPPPSVEGTIVDAPVHFATAALDDEDATAPELTARDVRSKHRRERERRGEPNSSDERRRRRKEDRKMRDEGLSGPGSTGDKSKRSSRPYNSLGYADMSAKTVDGRPAGGERKGWLKKIAGL
ncbi:hypothetical protein BDV97DRAFT_21834 [Delphinella strobiligena]|nr:hypothetical protein BDV97DRAFT_21834 [Delphinella strobiligena]